MISCVDRKALRRSVSDSYLQNYDKILKSGYLIKQGNIVKNWKKRWFVLRYYTISYFESQESIEPIRTIQMSDVKALRQTGLSLIEMDVGKRTFFLKCEIEQDAVEWLSAIRSRAFGAESTVSTATSKDRSSRVASLMKKYAPEENNIVPEVGRLDKIPDIKPEKKNTILSKSFYISSKVKNENDKKSMNKAMSVLDFRGPRGSADLLSV